MSKAEALSKTDSRRFACLFDAGISEFGSKPFEAASLNMIIKNAGISKGSFYHWFTDKLDLYHWIARQIAIDKQRYVIDPVESKHLDFFEHMEVLLADSLAFSQTDRKVYDFWRRLIAEDTITREKLTAPLSFEGQLSIERLIYHAIDTGELTHRFKAEHIVKIISTVLLSIDTLITDEMDTDEIKALVHTCITMIRDGLSGT
ncbi:MAG: TetR/AcrR family transcriptional regulator [Sphaerochaetaceae bacterium]|jgi:AcrR family transcriptional regulator|nr:TetR/AcrR family transcriptional regulator [Sphaerochaetaceae bacterium]NLO61406.1 TetR/AcrR family transcriptional regulator [Spirochaetales bacterium]MDD2406052.1 TetR/AcrR family transcriptional regulator [Sphaerochaetaceae bacterium]MDD3671132.1 TetR/AcrR family transcriptional regulator [Sphaerochaetaceae bacterium]MDD4258892.1 TetR/AcrR family transcriptional regulator [Sphaerochaetaceae bacterium]